MTNIATKKLSKSGIVEASSSLVAEWAPANGETVELIEFYPSGSVDLKGAAILYWDYGGDNEIIWSSYSSASFLGNVLENNSFAGDGAKKFAIVLRNYSLQSAYLSGAANFRVITE